MRQVEEYTCKDIIRESFLHGSERQRCCHYAKDQKLSTSYTMLHLNSRGAIGPHSRKFLKQRRNHRSAHHLLFKP